MPELEHKHRRVTDYCPAFLNPEGGTGCKLGDLEKKVTGLDETLNGTAKDRSSGVVAQLERIETTGHVIAWLIGILLTFVTVYFISLEARAKQGELWPPKVFFELRDTLHNAHVDQPKKATNRPM